MIELNLLTEEYVDNKLEILDICKKYDHSYKSIWQKIKRAGILKEKNNRSLNLTGVKFGELTAKRKLYKTKKGSWVWECSCECGKSCKIAASSFKYRKSCGCLHKLYGKNNPVWKGYEGISKASWGKIIDSAVLRNCGFDITIEYAWDLFIFQNKTCALSGLPISFPQTYLDKKDSTASLDRIDSQKGYIVGNVQWVHKIINKMKTNLEQDVFIDFCLKVAKNNISYMSCKP